MSKRKTWIKVKRGLNQPKHRHKMGECWWLYLHILDRTNWETGAVEEWRDEEEANEVEMPTVTLRRQRRKLEEEGYITCEQKQRGQRIVVHKWTNPRRYDGIAINPPDVAVLDKNEGDHERPPSEENDVEGVNQGVNQGIQRMITLPLDSQNHISHDSDSSLSQDNWVKVLMAISLDYYNGRNSQFERDWSGTGYVGREDGKFVVVCRDEEQQWWLKDHGKKIAENMLVGVLGERVEVEFVVEESVR